jgi:hypothetical protein
MDTAVLASVIVACKDTATADFELRHRAADLGAQLYDGWRSSGLRWCIKRIRLLFICGRMQDIGLALVDQNDSPAHVTYIQWFIVTVKYKNFASHLSHDLRK